MSHTSIKIHSANKGLVREISDQISPEYIHLPRPVVVYDDSLPISNVSYKISSTIPWVQDLVRKVVDLENPSRWSRILRLVKRFSSPYYVVKGGLASMPEEVQYDESEIPQMLEKKENLLSDNYLWEDVGKYLMDKEEAEKKRLEEIESGEAFLLSMLVGALGDNAALGGLVGGSLVGGVFGDFVADGELF